MRSEIQELIDRLISAIEKLELENVALREAAGLDNWKYRNVYPFNLKVMDMDLGVRVLNCLKNMEIDTVGDLVSFDEKQLLKCRNMGRKSLNRIINELGKKRLTLGMWRDPKRNYKW